MSEQKIISTNSEITIRINKDMLAKYIVAGFIIIMFFIYVGIFIFKSYDEIEDKHISADKMGDFIETKSKLLYDNISYLNTRFNIMDVKSQEIFVK